MQSPLQEMVPTLAGQSLRVLIWDRDLIDMWCLDESGVRVPYRGKGSRWHAHAEIELTVITHGSGMLAVGDHLGRFAASDCILLGPYLPHVWRSRGAMAGVSLQFQAADTDGLGALVELAPLRRLWERARRGLRWQGAAAERLRELMLGMEGLPALGRLGRFLDIAETMRAAPSAQARQLSARPPADDDLAARDRGMARVFDHLLQHYHEDVCLADLVRLSGRPQATFCRHFARLAGTTFTAYLNAIRLHDVQRGLAETERSVTDLAFAAGFANLSHFHALFRRATGATPSAYRRAQALA